MTVNENPETRTKKSANWEIQYAKFFTFPIVSSTLTDSPSSHLLRPIPSSRKHRLKGTWVPCSSSNVTLRIVIDDTSSGPTLLVSLHHSTYEEHYVSKLNFVWPQGYCRDKGTKRASRVIIACYRDRMGQIQKFAMRFSSCEECRKFAEVLKCLQDGNEVDLSNTLLSNMFSEGIGREITLVANSCSQQAAPERSDVALLNSFSGLLADCFTAANAGIREGPAEIDLNGFLVKKAEKPFIDVLEKLDSIIVGFGGDFRFYGPDA